MYKKCLVATILILLSITSMFGEEKTKKIRLIQDDAQVNMVTKVYKLKYASSSDLLPFVETAVMRYVKESKVQSLNYDAKGEQYLVVSTGEGMMPFIDDMITKLDRQGPKNEYGSLIEGTGISRFVLYPKYRATNKMVELVQWFNNYGQAWYDASTSMIYWKDSKYDGNETLKWLTALDRPVPQVELTVNIYNIRDSDLSDIGVDYLAWKNGPGLDILSVGYQAINMNSVEQLFSQSSSLWSMAGAPWGGYLAAPQFDMSFIRLLAQTGKAKAVSTGKLVVVNDFDNSYNIKFSPDFDNIQKDMQSDTTSIVSSPCSVDLTVKSPIVCFKQIGTNTDADTAVDVSGTEGTIIFGYQMATVNDVYERNNFGNELTQSSTVSSSLNLDMNVEKLLAVWTKQYDVEQTVGIPFLIDIPYAKYLFGTVTKNKSIDHMVMTVKAELINPDATLQKWAGEVITAADIPFDTKSRDYIN